MTVFMIRGQIIDTKILGEATGLLVDIFRLRLMLVGGGIRFCNDVQSETGNSLKVFIISISVWGHEMYFESG